MVGWIWEYVGKLFRTSLGRLSMKLGRRFGDCGEGFGIPLGWFQEICWRICGYIV